MGTQLIALSGCDLDDTLILDKIHNWQKNSVNPISSVTNYSF